MENHIISKCEVLRKCKRFMERVCCIKSMDLQEKWISRIKNDKGEWLVNG